MAVNIRQFSQPQLYNYRYDQLNRITAMDVYRSDMIGIKANSWTSSTLTTDYLERVSYDPNGNILKYLRNGAGPTNAMDSLDYRYSAGTNKLNNIRDLVNGSNIDANFPDDLDNQAVGNYQYDAIGNLTQDLKNRVQTIAWNVYGKITTLSKVYPPSPTGSLRYVDYTYNVNGQRIAKTIYRGSGDPEWTSYVRDAQGNIMAEYEKKKPIADDTMYLRRHYMYGSSRLGIIDRNMNVSVPRIYDTTLNLIGKIYRSSFKRGAKSYELTNHLGNVLATVSDQKFGPVNSGIVQTPAALLYDDPVVLTANDYYPFGMLMNGRNYNNAGSLDYIFGFEGKDNQNYTNGEGVQIDFGDRVYDPRVSRWLSLDPLERKYPDIAPYAFGANSPIFIIDIDGQEIKPHKSESYTLPSPVWANDLGVTYGGQTSISFSYNSNTKLYDMNVTAVSAYSVDLQQEGVLFQPTAFEKENPGISEETRQHERGHQDQIFDAAKKEISIKQGTTTFTGTGDVVFNKITETKVKELGKKVEAKIANHEFTTQKQVDSYVRTEQTKIMQDASKLVASAVLKNIQGALDQSTKTKHDANEKDANDRAAKKLGKILKYTQLGIPLKKDKRILQWKTYADKQKTN